MKTGKMVIVMAIDRAVRTRRCTRGFTLVEVMIAMVLGVFLLGGIYVFFASTRATYSDVQQLSRMQESLRFITDVIVRDARNAGFRDQLGLFGAEWALIGGYASLDQSADFDGNGLTIQYAGLGSCAEPFKSVRVVRNTYYVKEGALFCRGESTTFDPEENDGDGGWKPSVPVSVELVSGLKLAAFSFLDKDGVVDDELTTCSAASPDDAACIGVEITLEFEGLQSPGDDFDSRNVVLRSTFRNVILAQMYQDNGQNDGE